MTKFSEITFSTLASLFVIGLMISLTHLFLNKYIIRWIKNKRKQSMAGIYIPIGIDIIWIVFFLYSIYELASINLIISMFISGLVLLASWSNIKDFIQGIIFRLQEGNITGQRIKIGDFSGEVITLRNTKIDLQVENGEIVQYPYSKLSNQIIGISTSVKHFKYCTFSVSVPLADGIEETKNQIVTQILNIPWIVSTMKIETEIIDLDSEKVHVKIKAYTLDEKFIPKIQRALNLRNADQQAFLT